MKVISLISLSFLFLSSCVGTVQDASVKKSEIRVEDEYKLQFEGIEKAIAVSNKRVEVYFSGAFNGSGNYSYLINIPDYSSVPIMVSEENLRTNYEGLYQYTLILDSTSTGKSYSVSVDAQDDESEEIKKTETSISVSMFENKVADYTGILGVENLPGVDGLSKLKVLLGNAHKTPSLGGLGNDPQTFEIVAINANMLLPPDMDNDDLGISDGRYKFITNWTEKITDYTLVGLPKNTDFYIRARVLHRASTEDLNNPKLRSELNNIVFEASTLDDSASAVEIDAASFLISKPSGEVAKSSVIANWDSPNGVYDHLRLYWATSPTALNVYSISSDCSKNSINVDNSGIYCKKIDPELTTAQVTNLPQDSSHTFQLFVCLDNACSVKLPFNQVSAETSIVLPGFNGIQSVRIARNLNELSKLYLVVTPPDLSQSHFDGYVVRFSQSPDTDPAPVEIEVTTPTSTSLGNQSLTPYNYKTATEIEVNGVSYSSGNNYCYKVNLFYYDNTGSKVENDSEKFECVAPSVIGPDKDHFPGITSAQVSGSSIIVNWTPPTQGVFEYYEIFYTQLSPFSFNDAIVDTTVDYTFADYERETFFWGTGSSPTSLGILYGLSNGVYQVGILTYYSFGSSIIRSEVNEQIYTCTVLGAGTSSCTSP